jgi:hypothetical protein
MDTTAFQAIPQFSVESQILISILKDGNPGDIKTDEELTKACQRDTSTGGKGQGALVTAIRYCERQGIIWQRQRKAGHILCLNGAEILNVADSAKRHIKKTSTRTLRKLAAFKSDGMTDAGRARHIQSVATFGTLAQFAGQKQLTNITEPKQIPGPS